VVELDTSRELAESFNSALTVTSLLARRMVTLTVKSAPRRTVFGANTRYDLHEIKIHVQLSIISMDALQAWKGRLTCATVKSKVSIQKWKVIAQNESVTE